MKRLLIFICLISCTLTLISCGTGRYPYPKSSLTNEFWQSEVEVNPRNWTQKASAWFNSGGKTWQEEKNAGARLEDAMSKTIVNTSQFDSIKIKGDFYTQISGNEDDDHITIIGPNEAVRDIKVRVTKGVLCVEQVGKSKDIGRVTVVIGVKNLKRLEHFGNGNVEAIKLYSSGLDVKQYGRGCLYLSGRLNVKCVDTEGQGAVNIFTTESYGTKIITSKEGTVNMYAVKQFMVTDIKHRGTGNISLINARSNCLNIDANGMGKISIKGHVNIKDIRAYGQVCVYIITSASDRVCVYQGDDALVGIKGNVHTLYVYSARRSKFWGRTLIADNAYVETSGVAHANIMATGRVWAKAKDYSSIYFYGDPMILQAFEQGNGTVIALGTSSYRPLQQKRRYRDYKDELMAHR